MAWSYRQDLSDESYHEPGVMLIEGQKLPDTPRDAEHGKDMLDPSRVEKRTADAAKSKTDDAKSSEHSHANAKAHKK